MKSLKKYYLIHKNILNKNCFRINALLFVTFLCLVTMGYHHFVQVSKKQCHSFISKILFHQANLRFLNECGKNVAALWFLLHPALLSRKVFNLSSFNLISFHINIYVIQLIQNLTIFFDCFCGLITIFQNNFRTTNSTQILRFSLCRFI